MMSNRKIPSKTLTRREAELKKKIETYWLAPNRAHDAIGINFNYVPGMRPTEMTVSNHKKI